MRRGALAVVGSAYPGLEKVRARGPAATAPGLSLERFSAIVADIYECALDPLRWSTAVAGVVEAVGGRCGWVALHYPHQIRSIYEVEAGTDPEQQTRLREKYVAVSPFVGARHHFQEGDVLSVDDVIDYDDFLHGRFYQEWAGPQGWSDFIMGVLNKHPDRFSWLGIGMGEQAREEHKGRVAAFLPHVRRALRISDLLEFRAAQAADLTAVVEGLPTGLILLDASMRVGGVNPAAERMIAETGALSVAGGRLRAPDAAAAQALAAAIAACKEGRLDQSGASLLFGGPDGGLGLLVHLLPLPRRRGQAPADPVAALFLTNPTAPGRRGPLEAFVHHFGLTPSETRVLLGLLDGKTPRDIAAAYGAAMPTIRTHLSRLYDKTGTRGQQDLIRLVAGFGA
jgi:DNA-binding CsgD family transcriptional regulator/PAS domain-containing protein